MKILFLFCLIQFCHCQLDGSFWWQGGKSDVTESSIPPSVTSSNAEARSGSNSDAVCCECIPFFLCENGTINTDGGGILDLRIGGEPTTTPAPAVNVEVCPGEVDICCKVPDAPPSCYNDSPSTKEQPPYYATPHPESNCECTVFTSCDPFLVVSDGLGKTSIELTNGRIVNHSKCAHALDVCCYLPDFLGEYINNNTTPGTQECECVEPALCGPDGHIITDGIGIINVRIGPAEPPPQCSHDPILVCCLPPDQDPGTTIPPYTPPPTPSTPSTPSTPKPPPPPCGKRNNNGIGVRIVGFRDGQTQFGEFPWVATLLKKDYVMEKEYQFFLGGASLIHRRVAMTAAHKIREVPIEKILVRLGEWDTASTKEAIPFQDVAVDQVVIHPDYQPGPLFHDIALLILKEDANLGYHINPICPAKSLDDVIPSTCVINGWGTDAFRSENYQEIMKSVRLPLVGKETCQTLLRNTRLSKYFTLHPSFICAGGEEGVDACKGDGGGPLACQKRDDPSRYLQVGITAWGIGCGGKDVPGVYADVAADYTWIMNEVNTRFPEEVTNDNYSSPTEPTLTKEEEKAIKQQQRKEAREKAREERRKQRKENRKKKANKNAANTPS